MTTKIQITDDKIKYVHGYLTLSTLTRVYIKSTVPCQNVIHKQKKNNADMTGIKLTQQICIELLKSTRNENTTPTNKMSAVNIEVIKRREKRT